VYAARRLCRPPEEGHALNTPGGYPEPGRVYVDKKNPARQLFVQRVVVADPNGREIRGDLLAPGKPTEKYAADVQTFNRVWTAH
jgi:hypothetical protein